MSPDILDKQIVELKCRSIVQQSVLDIDDIRTQQIEKQCYQFGAKMAHYINLQLTKVPFLGFVFN